MPGMLVITRYLDNDGKHINLLVLSLFMQHMPELIKTGRIYLAMPPLYKARYRNKNYFLYKEEELKKYPGAEVSRFKGIGEMSANELWETTMNPATRTLIQLGVDNFDEAFQLYSTLMGKSSLARKTFIINNTIADIDDFDTFGDEEDFE